LVSIFYLFLFLVKHRLQLKVAVLENKQNIFYLLVDCLIGFWQRVGEGILFGFIGAMIIDGAEKVLEKLGWIKKNQKIPNMAVNICHHFSNFLLVSIFYLFLFLVKHRLQLNIAVLENKQNFFYLLGPS
jgi:hypothetical protein